MIWLALGLLALAALTPLLPSLRRRTGGPGRRDLAMGLHRAQLVELDRDLADGRIAPREHAAAVLEVQRRLLAAAAEPETAATAGPLAPVLAVLVLVPLAAFGLYLVGGSPEMPAAPLAERVAADAAAAARDDALLAQLRQRLAKVDPQSDAAYQGYALLGTAEFRRARWTEAAEALRTALAVRFDPTLAAQAGEALTRAEGGVTPDAAALFRRALAAAPADVPWRKLAEQRVAQAGP